jgi:hypothetical protein
VSLATFSIITPFTLFALHRKAVGDFEESEEIATTGFEKTATVMLFEDLRN